MDNLFIKNSFTKTASYSVDMDATKWVRNVITYFYEQYPFAQNQPAVVQWKKKDSTKGYAVGVLKISGASIPVVIKDWKLSPLDIVMAGGRTLPLNTEVLRTMLTSPGAFVGVASSPPKSGLDMFSQLQYSPDGSINNSASESSSQERPAKIASFIDKIEHIDKKAVVEILNTVKNNPEIHNNFKKTGRLDVLDKLASKTESQEEIVDSFIRDLDIDRQLVIKDSLGNHTVKQANSNIDFVWELPIKASEAEEFEILTASSFQEKTAESVDANCYKIWDTDRHLMVTSDKDYHDFSRNDVKTAEAFTLEEDQPQVGDLGVWKFGESVSEPFEVLGMDKVSSYSSNLYKLDGGPGYLSISKNKDWVILEKLGQKSSENVEIDGDFPKIGDFGAWVMPDGSATKPFEIRELLQDLEASSNKQVQVAGWDGLQKIAYYLTEMPVKSLMDSENGGKLLPKEAKFVKLGKELRKVSEVSEDNQDTPLKVTGWAGREKVSYYIDNTTTSEAKYVEKESSWYLSKDVSFIKLGSYLQNEIPHTVKVNKHTVGKDSVGLYYLKGAEFSKYAENSHELRDLSLSEAEWSLIHCGATKTDINKAAMLLKGTEMLIACPIEAPIPPKVFIDKIAETYEDSTNDIEMLKVDLVKEAAVLSDKSTVDAVLSLGAINKQNIIEYIALLPQYEMIMSELAKMLLMTRLGMRHLPEEAVKNAMDSVTKIVLLLMGVNKLYSN